MMVAMGKDGREAGRESGVALIVALLVVAILIAVTLQFTYTTTIDLKLVRNQSREVESYFAARGVVALAFTHLEEDRIADAGDEAIDTLLDPWAGDSAAPSDEVDLGDFAGGGFSRSIGGVAVQYEIVDEDRRICVNNLIVEELTLPMEEEERKEPPLPPGGGGGLKDENGEKEKPLDPKELAKERREKTRDFIRAVLTVDPFNLAKEEADTLIDAIADGAPYASLLELGQIEGVTEEMLLGVTDEFGRQPGLVDVLTVHSMGQINLNTAPKDVLAAVLRRKYGDEASYYAQEIVNFRTPPEEEEPLPDEEEEGDGGEGEEDEEPEESGGVFQSVDDLAKGDIPGLEGIFGGEEGEKEEVRKEGEALRRQLTVKSRFFSVKVTSGELAPRKEFRFVLKRGEGPGDPMPLLSWEERELPSKEEEDFP